MWDFEINRGERIAYAIKEAKVGKLSALAADIGVDESAVCRWRKGGKFNIDNAAAFCEVLDVSMDWIVLGRGNCFQHRRNSTSEMEHDFLLALRYLGEEPSSHLMKFLKCLLINR